MSRSLRCAAVVVLAFPASAAADRGGHGAVQIEVGLNTRHFAAAAPSEVVFRSTTGESDPSLAEGTALTTSIRFTGHTRFNTFAGVEGEVGQLVGFPESNFAGAYGVLGTRGDLGRARLSAELVAGRRWVRYEIIGREDPTKLVAEPRVRADFFVSPSWTLGAAVGATLSERQVWMAGVYVGVHGLPFDRQPGR